MTCMALLPSPQHLPLSGRVWRYRYEAALQDFPDGRSLDMTQVPPYFRFNDTHRKPPFVIQPADPLKIEHARRILCGEEHSCVHV
jgi:hypothetical protein